jgi:DTW domain-containing protein YfiP
MIIMTLTDQICLEVENAILKIKVQHLEDAIKDLISAVNALEVCPICYKDSGEFLCSGCPWHQAKVKAIRLLAKEEKQ